VISVKRGPDHGRLKVLRSIRRSVKHDALGMMPCTEECPGCLLERQEIALLGTPPPPFDPANLSSHRVRASLGARG